MAKKDVQDYLDKGMYGSPQIKPDEKKKYLGTYRERIVFAMKFDETKSFIYDDFCLEQFIKYPKGTLLMDANSDMKSQNHFMKIAQEKNISFRLVDSETDQLSNQDIAMVFTLDFPIDLEDISVKEKISKKITSQVEKQTDKKTSFLKKLFN